MGDAVGGIYAWYRWWVGGALGEHGMVRRLALELSTVRLETDVYLGGGCEASWSHYVDATNLMYATLHQTPTRAGVTKEQDTHVLYFLILKTLLHPLLLSSAIPTGSINETNKPTSPRTPLPKTPPGYKLKDATEYNQSQPPNPTPDRP